MRVYCQEEFIKFINFSLSQKTQKLKGLLKDKLKDLLKDLSRMQMLGL